ncbi:hypothetical protein P43SY_002490 [Pythium insidiosum]|uniref:C2 domain-containing protein n=1 Tax=Pythium insidiosum TaxID=114742 RepID=A0AAD5L9U7_PYTIN|nr:hypothetical protein P43SY_002490 [Pythium insidiosum]
MATPKTPSSTTRTPRLVVNVVSARNVGTRDSASSDAAPTDVFCQVRCGGDAFKTDVKEQTSSPEWRQEVTFGTSGTALGDSVAFKLYAYGRLAKDTSLGEASLALSSLVRNEKKEIVLPLQQAAESAPNATATAGELVVELLYEPDYVAPVAAPGTQTTASPPTSAASAATKSAPASETPQRPPNVVIVTVLEGKGLVAADGKGESASSDPIVKITCTKNKSQKTKVVKKALHPKWRQRFYFLLTETRQVVDFIVEDDDMFSNDFLGQCTIDVQQWRAQFGEKKNAIWLALQPRKGEGDLSVSDIGPERNMNYGLGRLCIALEFSHIGRKFDSLEQGEQDHSTAVPASQKARNVSEPLSQGDTEEKENAPEGEEGAEDAGGEQAPEGGNDDGDEDEEEDEEKRKQTEEELKKQEEERRKKFDELSEVQFHSGEYQIQVRVIEVRDLKPMDVNGSCDPVVSVECLGQRQHTMVKTKQLSCVFDEHLIFSFKHLDKDTVQQGSIKVTVLDADGPGSSSLARLSSDTIGSFTVDLSYVYFQKDHELHRRWVALVGNDKTNSDSIQGYLLLSIVVLGPGDRLRIRPPSSRRDEEALDRVQTKEDINSLVLVPPRVIQTLHYLVVTIYQAQDLPDMDQSMMKKGGVDGYAKVYFAGQDILETKKVTVKGNKNLTVEFNQELWFPVLLPTMSNSIAISLWDWDLTVDELIGNTAPYSFARLQSDPASFVPHWTNIYGPPVGYISESAAQKHMFRNPAVASTYRGRMLLSMRMEDGSKAVHDRPHTRNITTAMPLTPTKAYTLRAAVYYGTEIPMFVSKTSWNRNSRMSIRISIGRHEVASTRVENVNGMCYWNQYIEIPNVNLPTDLKHVPDVFIHLVRQKINETRLICFARFKASEVLKDQTADELKIVPDPEWVSFREDTVLNELKDHDFTGNVLLTMQLNHTQSNIVESETAQAWREQATASLTYTKYTLFAHMFQGKCLPAADANGALDAYVKVTCGGAQGKSGKRLATRDPCFYETVCLDVDLPQLTKFLPMVSVQVFDWDQWDADDYVGAARFSLLDVPQLLSSEYSKLRSTGKYKPPRPTWYPISYASPGDTEGELLLSLELVRKEMPGLVIDPPESIRPPMEDRFLEITCLGCRGLEPVGFMPVNTPFVKFEAGEVSRSSANGGARFTNPSSTPSGRNPNFLERIVVPIKIPIDALYAPRLNISVYDQLLGGFYKPLLGMCSVDLRCKMPLSNGKPNPLYMEPGGSVLTGNPYLAKGVDLSTYPGTLPPVSNRISDAVTAPSRDRTASHCSATGSMREESKSESTDFGAGVGFASRGISNVSSHHDQIQIGDEDDDTPHYLRDRARVDGSLEDVVLSAPFETYELFRGDMLVRKRYTGGKREPTFRAVGRFKGLIRLLKNSDEPALFDLDQFLSPQPYLVRVYVLDALNLTPKDENNKCDPYLRISLGDGRKRHHLINDREHFCKETLHPRFHKMYEFKSELPGASELRIELLDYDFFALPTIPAGLSNGLTAVGTTVGGDDFIGATLIDLEDRWFSQKWQQLGAHPDRYEKHKPLEVRPLFAPFSTMPQGSIRLWVDILTPQEMKLCKPLDISLPPPRQFEVRVIVYRARNVIPGDFTELSDLFVKCWLQSRHDKAQTTDTHWRARDGKASFNWRMKFDISLPVDDENEADKGYLHFQLWDKDVLYDDCLADSVIDLGVFLRQAYKTNDIVNVFAKKKEVRVRGTNSAPSSMRVPISGSVPSSQQVTATNSGSVSINVMEDLKRPLLGDAPRDAEDSMTMSRSQFPPSSAPRSGPAKDPSLKRKENAESLVKSIKQRLGMGEDPEDASWLSFTTRDPTTGDRVRAGELLVSVEILPVGVANARAAGLGRSEPNSFPFLAEPADRLQLSAMWNPMYVLEAFMGPKYYRAFSSGLVCVLFVALIIFAGPLVNVFVTLLELIPQPYGFIVFGILLALLLLSVSCVAYRCNRAFASTAAAQNN